MRAENSGILFVALKILKTHVNKVSAVPQILSVRIKGHDISPFILVRKSLVIRPSIQINPYN